MSLPPSAGDILTPDELADVTGHVAEQLWALAGRVQDVGRPDSRVGALLAALTGFSGAAPAGDAAEVTEACSLMLSWLSDRGGRCYPNIDDVLRLAAKVLGKRAPADRGGVEPLARAAYKIAAASLRETRRPPWHGLVSVPRIAAAE